MRCTPQSAARAALILAVLAPAFIVAAQPVVADLSALQARLTERYPQVQILQVAPSPIAGLYEVFTGDSVAYADPNGDYLIVGQMMETATRRNLSSERVDALLRVDTAGLPLDKTIRYSSGKGSRHVYVFSDPDCPFCKQLEKDLATLDDVTVHILLYPLASLHPDAVARARAIWCSSDRAEAWSAWMLRGQDATSKDDCGSDPVDEILKIGRELRIASTPTLVFANGQRFTGAPPRDQLTALLDAAQK